MTRKPISIKKLSTDEEAFYTAINLESDMVCVVVGTAYIDAILASLLQTRLADSKTTTKLLSGALSDFRTRADLSYCLSLINKEYYQDSIKIAEIRNQFAHSHLKLNFSELTITKLCAELKGWSIFHSSRHGNITPRKKFILTVTAIAVNLLNLSKHKS